MAAPVLLPKAISFSLNPNTAKLANPKQFIHRHSPLLPSGIKDKIFWLFISFLPRIGKYLGVVFLSSHIQCVSVQSSGDRLIPWPWQLYSIVRPKPKLLISFAEAIEFSLLSHLQSRQNPLKLPSKVIIFSWFFQMEYAPIVQSTLWFPFSFLWNENRISVLRTGQKGKWIAHYVVLLIFDMLWYLRSSVTQIEVFNLDVVTNSK